MVENKIAIFPADRAAMYEYRINRPIKAVAKKHKDIQFNIHEAITSLDIVAPYKTIVWNRQYSKGVFEVMLHHKLQNHAVNIYDIDDDLFNIDQSALGSSSTFNNCTREGKIVLNNLETWIRTVDYVTVSTEHLKDRLSGINKNITVLPNAIDMELFKRKDKEDKDDIIIGWTGSATHNIDVEPMASAVVEVVNRHKNVKLLTTLFEGYDFWKGIDESKVIKFPWVSFEEYPDILRQIDIGICPLKDNLFNRSKSAIKYLELGALGIPAICSSVEPYKNVIANRENGILIKTKGAVHKKWVDALEALIEDEKLRKAIAEAAFNNVKENHNQDKVAEQWYEFYRRFNNDNR